MQFKDALKNLESSKEFKEWRKENKEDYLVHGFATLVSYYDEPFNWQIGYYNKKTDKITPFDVGENIVVGEPSEAFKKTEIIEELDIKKVTIRLAEALKKVEQKQKEEYSTQTPMKIFCVIQNYEKYKEIWNITIVTIKMNTLNIKIDPMTGKIKEDKLSSLMSFSQE